MSQMLPPYASSPTNESTGVQQEFVGYCPEHGPMTYYVKTGWTCLPCRVETLERELLRFVQNEEP